MDAVAHLQHFGLKRDPFASDASLGQVQETPPFGEAARRVRRAIAQERGLCVLTGEAGSGKTLLVRSVLDALEEEVCEACMLVPVPAVSDATWVLDRFARQLGVEEPAEAPAALVGQVYEQLAIVREDGRHAVLFVDEAQVLADRGALGELRGLLNLEYEDRRLLTLIFAGLPHLGQEVARDPALAGRVDVRARLGALAPEAVAAYVRERLRAADADPELFDGAALEALASLGHGLPRRTNTLADGALFEASLAGRGHVARTDVERAAAELDEAEGEAPARAPAEPVRPFAPEAAAAPAPGGREAPERPSAGPGTSSRRPAREEAPEPAAEAFSFDAAPDAAPAPAARSAREAAPRTSEAPERPAPGAPLRGADPSLLRGAPPPGSGAPSAERGAERGRDRTPEARVEAEPALELDAEEAGEDEAFALDEVVADETGAPVGRDATEAVAVPEEGPPKEDELDDLFAGLVEDR